MLKKHSRTNYLPSLDGLRAIAIILVLLYHFNIPFFSGGFIGVDIFFVLSGYLITSKLLSEWRSQQSIDFKRFWIKRIRRLIPAVVVMILVVLVVSFLFYPSVFHKSWKDGIASFFYVSNWWYIFSDVPYFQKFGTPSPFKHLWSLAIEEQFYLVWPIVFVGLLTALKKRQHVLKVILASGFFSMLLMWLLYSPENINRVYYGTDTRLFTLALGCSLAFVWPFYLLEDNFNKKEARVIDSVGAGSLLILLVMVVLVKETQSFLYPGGFFLIAVLASLLLAVIAHPSSQLARLFSNKYLVWLGKRSYSIYLWHFPVVALTTSVKTFGTVNFLLIGLQLVVILCLASASYTYVEMPIIKYGFRGYFNHVRAMNKGQLKMIIKKIALIIAAALLLWSYSDYLSKGKFFFQKNVAKIEQKQKTQPKEDSAPKPKKVISKVLAIGDSVLLGIKDEFEKAVPGAVVDGKVGRQLTQAQELIKQKYKDFNHQDAIVFIELGSNSTFDEKELDKLIRLLDQSQIYLVNTKVPREWENEVNDMLLNATKKYKNVHLIDWYQLAKTQPAILNDDGIHIAPDHKSDYLTLYTDVLNDYKLDLPKKN